MGRKGKAWAAKATAANHSAKPTATHHAISHTNHPASHIECPLEAHPNHIKKDS